MAETIPANRTADRVRALFAEAADLLVAMAESTPQRRVDKLYSLTEVGRELGICRTSVRNSINRGELKTLKVGGRRFITESQLAAFIEERSRDGAR